MITPWLSTVSAYRIGAALLVIAAAAIVWLIWHDRRNRPTDWTAPARDLNEVDAAYADVRSALYGHRRIDEGSRR